MTERPRAADDFEAIRRGMLAMPELASRSPHWTHHFPPNPIAGVCSRCGAGESSVAAKLPCTGG
jgi:hypothetical protein